MLKNLTCPQATNLPVVVSNCMKSAQAVCKTKPTASSQGDTLDIKLASRDFEILVSH